MRGDLSEMSAADACRAIAGSGSTGVLMIDGPEATGTITLVDGAIVGATSPVPRARLGDRLVGAGFLAESELRDALEAQRASGGRARLGALLVERTQVPHDAIRLFVQEQALDALFELVRWRHGTFDFVSGTPGAVPEVPVEMRVDDALLEISRRHDQWAELSEVIPDLEAVPVFSTDPTSAAASLEPDEFAVLASVDGERSVRTLADDLGYSEFELARIVHGLVMLGVIEIRLPEDEIGSGLDEALDYLDRVVAVEATPDDPADDPADYLAPDGPAPDGPAPGEPAPDDPVPDDHDPYADFDARYETVQARADDTTDLGFFTSPTSVPEGTVVESDLPERSTSDVLRELRVFDAEVTSDEDEDAATARHAEDTATAATNHAEDTTAAREPESRTDADSRIDAESRTDAGEGRLPASDARRYPSSGGPREDDDGDVAEFLRELSRLALDEEAPPQAERSRRPAPATEPREDDNRKKRRGLFGR